MKKIIIIAPQFPPCNLAAVHRTRFFAMHLPKFGWEPIIVTVQAKYYEEKLDWDLVKLLPKELRVEKVKATWFPRKIRLIGDISLRAYRPLLKRVLEITKNEKIDFVYIPIPPYYSALIGRTILKKRKVPFGIDYIDPWVVKKNFRPDEKFMNRHWWYRKLAYILEPIAIKKASLITGVAPGYYEGALERNPYLKNKIILASMPYGGEIKDHEGIKDIQSNNLIIPSNNKLKFIYAGALLPNAIPVLENILKSMHEKIEYFKDVEFYFIGSGKHPNDIIGYNVKPFAEKYNLWRSVIFEFPARIPYLDVLKNIEKADAVFILGSTSKAYTPSKTYQGVLSKKPIFAVLNSHSTAGDIIEIANAGIVLKFDGEKELSKVNESFYHVFEKFRSFYCNFDHSKIDYSFFNQYSAENVTKQLANTLDKAIGL